MKAYVIIAYTSMEVRSGRKVYWLGNEAGDGKKWSRDWFEAKLYGEPPEHPVLDHYRETNGCRVEEVDDEDFVIEKLVRNL